MPFNIFRIPFPEPIAALFAAQLRNTNLPDRFSEAIPVAADILHQMLMGTREGTTTLDTLPEIHHHRVAVVEGIPVSETAKELKVTTRQDLSTPETRQAIHLPSVTMAAILMLSDPPFNLGTNSRHQPTPQLLTPIKGAHRLSVYATEPFMHTDSIGTRYDVRRTAVFCVNNDKEMPTIFIPLELVKDLLGEEVIHTLQRHAFYISTTATPKPPTSKDQLFPILRGDTITYNASGIVQPIDADARVALFQLNKTLKYLQHDEELHTAVCPKEGDLLSWNDRDIIHCQGQAIHPERSRALLRYLLTEGTGTPLERIPSAGSSRSL